MNQHVVRGSRWVGGFLGMVVLAGLCLAAPARSEVLFRASFDGSLDAKTAKGSPAGKPSPATVQPVFTEGISGKALDIGSLQGRVLYEAKGNLLSERGSITFWARRTGPQPKDHYTFHLGGWGNKDGSWVLIYKWSSYADVCMLHGRGGAGDVGAHLGNDGDDGRWHFYTFTWDGQHVRGYFDGQLVSGSESFEFPVSDVNYFFVGGGDETARAIDEFTVFDQALGPGDVKQLYRQMIAVETNPLVTVPPRRAPIVIDGKITPAEWAGAAETTGFADFASKTFAVPQTVVKLTYDRDAFYLAFTGPLPEKVKRDYAMTAGMTGILKQTVTDFDASVDGDDSYEFTCVPEFPAGTWHRFVFNGLNTHYDYSISPEGVIALKWNPEWESASTVDADGWHAEVRVPFTGFGRSAPVPGTVWGMNFSRHWYALKYENDIWRLPGPVVSGRPQSTGRVVWGGADTPLVQLSDWGPVNDNLLAVSGRVVNPGGAADVEVRLTSDSGEVSGTRLVTVGAGAAAPFEFTGRIQNPATGRLVLEAANQRDKGIVLRSEVPVSLRDALEITTANYPSAGLYRVSVDAGSLRSTPLDRLSLSVEVLSAAGATVGRPVVLNPMPGYTCDATLSTGALADGRYTVRCRVESGGKKLAEKTFDYEKKPRPAWYGNTIGITDQVPKPFTPVVRRGDLLACWGREYRFDGQLLPIQMTTQGEKLFAGPARLVLADAAGKELVPGRTTVSWGRKTDFRAEFTRSCRYGGVPVETSSWIECDGLLWTTLRISPSAAALGKVVLRVPLNPEWSSLINTYDYSVASTGRLKESGWEGGDSPLWLGNERGGLQWMTETLLPCRLQKGTRAVRVIPGARENVFELTIINEPTKLTKPLEFSWGWIATPVRPSAPDYRGWLTGNCSVGIGYRWYYPSGPADMDPRWLTTFPNLFVSKPVPRPDGLGQAIGSAGPYIVTGQCSEKVPECRDWADEWSASSHGRQVADGTVQCSVASPSWVDFLVWCYRNLYDRERFMGLYYDCALFLPDDNFYHGAGYKTEAGAVLPVNQILAARQVAKRMYCMLREREPERTAILYHHSGCINMAVLSWSDVYVDGENFTSLLSRKNQDYHKLYPPDAFAAQSMGHNFGPNVWFLDEFTRSGAIREEDWKTLGIQPVTHLYGLVLLHDSGYWRAYGNKEGYRLVDDALKKYHFDENYRMIPYWSQKVVALPDKVFATFYRNDKTDTVLMVLLNNNENDLDLKLKLDWKALGFSDWKNLRVDDPVFQGKPVIDQGVLITPVGRANMRLLAIQGEK